MHCSTSKQRERHYNDLLYMIPYQLLRDNTRNIAVVHAYTRKGGLEMTVLQKGKKRAKRGKKEKEKKGKKNETKSFMHARRA